MFYQKLILCEGPVKAVSRRNARQFALQAIYSWQITRFDLSIIEKHFLSADKYEEEKYHALEPSLSMPETDVTYFRRILSGVILSHLELDRWIYPYLSRSIKDLGMMELALLRIAIYEMKYCSIPYKVVINEAIELAKLFAAEDSYKFVNGILDKVSHVQ
ncbi:N utilization substance protein B [Candidatus Photodesmus katoptron]|uniref:transcription antitermination factor NusB n=1 Tax=Candidatus Photodesmus anomalopis TaxID=28176 RepID=UPI0004D3859E|nr:transcription antitermination factor NusB [Candidatus Photodesmus katoptron]KEY90279.1 N utilization substance protein B [Candidatus Photodesmus katoptron]